MDFHVLSTIHRDGADSSPLQFISDEQLGYYRHAEAVAQAFVTLVVGVLLAGAIVWARAGDVLVIGA